MGIRVGYTRVSTGEQTHDLQVDALKKAECQAFYADTISGALGDRPGLEAALQYVREGDTLVVWKLDRLGRSLKHLIETMTTLQQRGVGFMSLTEHIDTTTAGGKLIFHLFGALAEFERDLIRERTKAGLAAARTRGTVGGRPAAEALNTAKKRELAQRLYEDPANSIGEICRTLHISKSTLYRYIETGKRVPERGNGKV